METFGRKGLDGDEEQSPHPLNSNPPKSEKQKPHTPTAAVMYFLLQWKEIPL